MTSPELGTVLAKLLRRVVREELDRALCELSPEPPPALLDRQQLAKELGCSAAKVDRLRRDGMPFVRLGPGGVRRYELAPVLSWLRNRTRDDDDRAPAPASGRRPSPSPDNAPEPEPAS
jgi:hypothetical protein